MTLQDHLTREGISLGAPMRGGTPSLRPGGGGPELVVVDDSCHALQLIRLAPPHYPRVANEFHGHSRDFRRERHAYGDGGLKMGSYRHGQEQPRAADILCLPLRVAEVPGAAFPADLCGELNRNS